MNMKLLAYRHRVRNKLDIPKSRIKPLSSNIPRRLSTNSAVMYKPTVRPLVPLPCSPGVAKLAKKRNCLAIGSIMGPDRTPYRSVQPQKKARTMAIA